MGRCRIVKSVDLLPTGIERCSMARFFSCWLLALLLSATGCGNFMATRIVQAPNSYPSWLAPVAPVELAFADALLTNFPAQFLQIDTPVARLRYRVVAPADYQFRFASTNWIERGRSRSRFSFRATFPGQTNNWTAQPRGTVILLHGYGVGMFAMSPWSLQLAQQGWRCVLVDLRGHGKSTGSRIYFGTQETFDLSQLLDELSRAGKLAAPVVAVGHSYGAVTALRWRTTDARVQSVVALSPYAVLADAVLNISREYSSWMPESLLRSGLERLPGLLQVDQTEFDTRNILRRQSRPTLFIAGAADKITPATTARELFELNPKDSELLIVPNATHEALPYFFAAIEPVLADWLRSAGESPGSSAAD